MRNSWTSTEVNSRLFKDLENYQMSVCPACSQEDDISVVCDNCDTFICTKCATEYYHRDGDVVEGHDPNCGEEVEIGEEEDEEEELEDEFEESETDA
jgi:hypothetical protein